MSVGERIAQKRKELGLSQEALGEQLCVSRQAIYKWESDATLPEIEKLVALAKLFSVPVGWLLGVEEESAAPEDDGELTEKQLQMVEEIVGRYLAAQPQPKKVRRWPKVAAAILIVVVGIHLFDRLDRLNNQYNNLQNSVGDISSSVYWQINNITGRVEEILKSQNELTADYGTEMIRADLAANTATFALRAVPKTFVDGMSAVFLLNSGSGPVEVEADLSAGGVFSAEATTELTDEIILSVVFINPDGTRQTQLLDTYQDYYTGSIPDVWVDYFIYDNLLRDDVMHIGINEYATVREVEAKELPGSEPVTVVHADVGLFVNQRIVAWGTECEKPDQFQGDWEGHIFFHLPDVEVKLREGDKVQVAALLTDNYGRQFMASEVPRVLEYDEKENLEFTYPSDGRYDRDPASWVLTNYEVEEIFHTTTPIKKVGS